MFFHDFFQSSELHRSHQSLLPTRLPPEIRSEAIRSFSLCVCVSKPRTSVFRERNRRDSPPSSMDEKITPQKKGRARCFNFSDKIRKKILNPYLLHVIICYLYSWSAPAPTNEACISLSLTPESKRINFPIPTPSIDAILSTQKKSQENLVY